MVRGSREAARRPRRDRHDHAQKHTTATRILWWRQDRKTRAQTPPAVAPTPTCGEQVPDLWTDGGRKTGRARGWEDQRQRCRTLGREKSTTAMMISAARMPMSDTHSGSPRVICTPHPRYGRPFRLRRAATADGQPQDEQEAAREARLVRRERQPGHRTRRTITATEGRAKDDGLPACVTLRNRVPGLERVIGADLRQVDMRAGMKKHRRCRRRPTR